MLSEAFSRGEPLIHDDSLALARSASSARPGIARCDGRRGRRTCGRSRAHGPQHVRRNRHEPRGEGNRDLRVGWRRTRDDGQRRPRDRALHRRQPSAARTGSHRTAAVRAGTHCCRAGRVPSAVEAAIEADGGEVVAKYWKQRSSRVRIALAFVWVRSVSANSLTSQVRTGCADAEFYAVGVRCHGGAKEETVGGCVSLDNGSAGVVPMPRPDNRRAFATVDPPNERHSS